MSENYQQVDAEDFSKITIEKLPHQIIETALIQLGGGGVKGMEYKNEMLKYAGWTNDKLTTYAKDPKKAAAVFNKIRNELGECENADELRTKLEPKFN